MTDPCRSPHRRAAVPPGSAVRVRRRRAPYPVQDADGSVTDVPGFVRSIWRPGRWAPRRSSWPCGSGLGPLPGGSAVGLSLAGAGLLPAFGLVVLVTALVSGHLPEASFLLFAVGLPLLVVGAVPLGSRAPPRSRPVVDDAPHRAAGAPSRSSSSNLARPGPVRLLRRLGRAGRRGTQLRRRSADRVAAPVG